MEINYYTALSDVAVKVMREQSKLNPSGSFTELKQGVKQAIVSEVERCLRIWGSAGRAAEVLTQCEPWSPVEHLIIHNVKQLDEAKIKHMMAEGRRLLIDIPGVRGVFTGEAIQHGKGFQCCWIVHLANKNVIKNFREHPDFIEFSKKFISQSYIENVHSIDFLDNSSTGGQAKLINHSNNK